MPGTCHIHRSTKPSYYPKRQSQNRKIVNNYEVKIIGAGSKPQMNIEYDRLPHESFRDSASRGYDLLEEAMHSISIGNSDVFFVPRW